MSNVSFIMVPHHITEHAQPFIVKITGATGVGEVIMPYKVTICVCFADTLY